MNFIDRNYIIKTNKLLFISENFQLADSYSEFYIEISKNYFIYSVLFYKKIKSFK
jgi:hypothetical protein